MEKQEKETIILINEADLEDGFIIFSTTKKSFRDRLLKRLGSSNVIKEEVSGGMFTIYVKASRWSRTNFGFKSNGKVVGFKKGPPKDTPKTSLSKDICQEYR